MLPVRIEDKIERVPESGCWVWMGELNRNGYGIISYNGRRRVVHRVVWELLGFTQLGDKILDHLCRVRCCCNPAHVEPVTHQVNTLRGKVVLFK